MTQKIATSLLRLWSEEVDSMRSDMLMADLLSLRAAVRRWRDARAAYWARPTVELWPAFADAEEELIAEMGGIDKDGGS